MKQRFILAGVAVASILAGACQDAVQFSNHGTNNGILVDGQRDGTHHNDDRFDTTASTLGIGNYEISPQSNEVIGYTDARPPKLVESVPWTSGGDTATVTFENKYTVSFYVWIVKGPFNDEHTRAINACIKTSQIWTNERQGIGFSVFDIKDATADADASSFFAFTCSSASSIKTDIGFDASGVNIYYVDTVDFGSGAGTGNGVWCGGNVVAMGRSTSDHLFAHEIGHAFALGHVNSLTTFFDQTNVMHNASNTRQYLTEGQTFRAIIHPSSSINGVYNKRPGQTTRNCGDTTTTNDDACPPLQKRVWGDGASWPPN